MSERTAVYRLFDATGDLLYVGVAANYGRRWQQHAADKPWWPEVAREAVEWHQDRVLALAAESQAIMWEGPRFNRVSGHLTPEGGKTQHRSVRVSDEDWADLEAAAAAAGADRAKIINQLLRWYLRRPGAKLPERPQRPEHGEGG